MAEQASALPEQPRQSDGYKWIALIAIILGTFVTVLNNSLINVALPKLVTVFESTMDTIQWVLTGYMLASAVVIPMSAICAERFGYKKVYLLTLALFTLCSLLCGLAWSDTTLILFRIIQGLSGGFIMPIGMAMIYMIMPRQQIGMALGLWGIAAMVAPAVGPTLSGFIIEYFNWRLLFFMNVPIGVFAVVMAWLLLRETEKKPIPFDLPGAVLSVVGFGTLLLALSKGQSEGWDSLYIVMLFAISAFSLILLIWVETGRKNPLMELSLFRIPAFTISTIASGMVMLGMFGGIFLTPIFLQNIQGLTALQTGLVLMPQSIAMALMMPFSGRLFDRFGVLPLGLIGLSMMGITTFELHRLTVDTPNEWLDMVLVVRGIGIGLCMMPLTTAGMTAVPSAMAGRASSLSNVFRQVMGSLGIAVLTTIMSSRQSFHTASISEHVSLTSDTAQQTIQMLSGMAGQSMNTSSASSVALQIIGGLVQKEAAVRAIADTFLLSSIPIFASLPLVFFLRRRTAKQQADVPVEQG
ncbi:DHA2 family efflux MFS transporter permease subunit [Brevibacillus humidisoli]|uniref:DHA2 family efflux MFS transporter permease subunit n=1 Tax=Brevibacillus humidisoli TaxID=2895522 RepID=UPI001E32FB27|nr:DHA2 family efflux MFS transporter permease subunit [Brevibacillus humidisoli]UFJ39003.1 DHA2 family efflux MFS transporter permease subunit [Brevibacillus humidisoli]